MFSDYGIRNIGNSLGVWRRELETMHSLLTDSKRSYFPKSFVKLLGYTLYNAKKRSDAHNDLKVAAAHANHAKRLPGTIKNYIPSSCYDFLPNGIVFDSIGNNALIHSHNTYPASSQKYKLPMWQVPDSEFLDESDIGTIKASAKDYRATKDKYISFAKDVLKRLGALK